MSPNAKFSKPLSLLGLGLVVLLVGGIWYWNHTTPARIWEDVWHQPPPPSVHLRHARHDSGHFPDSDYATFFGFEADQAYVDLQKNAPRSRKGIKDLRMDWPSWFEPKDDPMRFEIVDHSNETGKFYLFIRKNDSGYTCYMAMGDPG